MIKIVKKDLLSNDFKAAMTKVATCSKLNTQTTYRVMRTTKLLEAALKKTQKEFSEIVKSVAETDIKGNPLLNEDKTDYVFKSGVEKEDAVKKLEDFVSGTIEIDRERFELDDLSPAGLTAVDLAMLEPLYNQPEA